MEYLEMSRWVWILLFAILSIVSGMAYYFMKRKRHAQWLSHIDQVTKLKMESIRNRVSPHFIFNVLNREISTEEEGSLRRRNFPGWWSCCGVAWRSRKSSVLRCGRS